MSGQSGLDDVDLVELFDLRLECFLGIDAFVDRHRETLKDLVAQQRSQLRLVAFCKGGDDHFESAARTFDEMSGIKARIGTPNSVQPLGDLVRGGRLTGRPRDTLVWFDQRRYVAV